jgi:hypothetical protein
VGSSPTPGAAKLQVEAGIELFCGRVDEMCPAVVPRRFRHRRDEAASALLFATPELWVSIATSRRRDFRDRPTPCLSGAGMGHASSGDQEPVRPYEPLPAETRTSTPRQMTYVGSPTCRIRLRWGGTFLRSSLPSSNLVRQVARRTSMNAASVVGEGLAPSSDARVSRRRS